jgi:toxin ParE1/3/4
VSRRVLRRPEALQDIADQAIYIAASSPAAAERYLEALEVTLQQLAQMPGIGRSRDYVSQRLAGLRQWPVKGFDQYLIFYRADEYTVEVVRVLHGARDIAAILDE